MANREKEHKVTLRERKPVSTMIVISEKIFSLRIDRALMFIQRKEHLWTPVTANGLSYDMAM